MSVVVEQYNPEWPQNFQHIKSRLEACLQDVPYIAIEHVGSTSVPGLAAKPIIDVDIIVARENVEAACNALVAQGFHYMGEFGITDRHAVRDPNQSPPRNIYICVDGAANLRNHLAIRNTLRTNAELRDEYARVKMELGANDTNIIDYNDAKSAIILKTLVVSGMLSEEELAEIKKVNVKGEKFGATKTERLLMREFIMKDIDGYYELESNEENARYQDWPPRTMDEARDLVIANMRNSCITPRTTWELVVESEGRLIGRVGAALKRLDVPDRKHPVNHFDLWFSFLPSAQGKGFATEAMKTFIDELVKKRNDESVELEIECDPRNNGSWQLAERLGFEKHSLTEKAWESKGEMVDSLVYRKIIVGSEVV